ncbi:60S ribosomal protein L13 (nucleomorph) [Chroomonas mesostigmatica CCMP1168]|uniref:60S ribosomal protein L13 n=1 Tax=Chroomonas mesostigmatica CCMP1168 TaxID=1195612 RepID=J7G5B7_9CRYP|nr:60S ribosomal protein L13 [Chroomonas mesostigmatica CCMP1168]|mmetsp:Transcript_16300/g.39761  ORF Transcript_16300/g.39761 Transcript_16300/m.39761 type:complete len:130 (-) Transcript_16300:875-1264(-)
MVKHNNAIPKAHFKKNWQRFVKTWFNQPAKKSKRKLNRNLKKFNNNSEKNIQLEKIRPIVHCPTNAHNVKIKIGRGFSKEEIDTLAYNRNRALSMGISVDKRRRSTNLGKKTNKIRLENLLISEKLKLA